MEFEKYCPNNIYKMVNHRTLINCCPVDPKHPIVQFLEEYTKNYNILFALGNDV